MLIVPLFIVKAICIKIEWSLHALSLVFALEDLSFYPNQHISGALVNLVLIRLTSRLTRSLIQPSPSIEGHMVTNTYIFKNVC